MISASSLAFPGSRTLAGWWRQLAGFQPQAFAVGYLFLHRVEAPVSIVRPKPIDRFSGLVLRALELESRCPAGDLQLESMAKRLCLDRFILLQVLRGLAVAGLATNQDHWRLTPMGKDGLRLGAFPVAGVERRVFHFLERCDAAGNRTHPPHFLNLQETTAAGPPDALSLGIPWQAGDDYPFAPELLGQCLDQPDTWKEQAGFDREVRAVPDRSVLPEQTHADPGDWQRVIVNRPERWLAVLALIGAPSAGGGRLLGFAARQEGWMLHTAAPILDLANGWTDLFPELALEPTLEALKRAWEGWVQARGVGDPAAAGCSLSLAGHGLRAYAPAPLLDHLRAARSDLSKGEAWLLIGDGRFRRAAQLELVKRETP
jgi:hypothetical protein